MLCLQTLQLLLMLSLKQSNLLGRLSLDRHQIHRTSLLQRPNLSLVLLLLHLVFKVILHSDAQRLLLCHLFLLNILIITQGDIVYIVYFFIIIVVKLF